MHICICNYHYLLLLVFVNLIYNFVFALSFLCARDFHFNFLLLFYRLSFSKFLHFKNFVVII